MPGPTESQALCRSTGTVQGKPPRNGLNRLKGCAQVRSLWREGAPASRAPRSVKVSLRPEAHESHPRYAFTIPSPFAWAHLLNDAKLAAPPTGFQVGNIAPDDNVPERFMGDRARCQSDHRATVRGEMYIPVPLIHEDPAGGDVSPAPLERVAVFSGRECVDDDGDHGLDAVAGGRDARAADRNRRRLRWSARAARDEVHGVEKDFKGGAVEGASVGGQADGEVILDWNAGECKAFARDGKGRGGQLDPRNSSQGSTAKRVLMK
ncbi:hypothetical protein FB451DRAFT_1371682 [Mycena latifolia]|nr:hypothetical protein FB451DRAFT_1371682 [Mycena latifolia]